MVLQSMALQSMVLQSMRTEGCYTAPAPLGFFAHAFNSKMKERLTAQVVIDDADPHSVL